MSLQFLCSVGQNLEQSPQPLFHSNSRFISTLLKVCGNGGKVGSVGCGYSGFLIGLLSGVTGMVG